MKDPDDLSARFAAAIRNNAIKYGIPSGGWRHPTYMEEMQEDMEQEEHQEFATWFRQHLAENGWVDEVRDSLRSVREEIETPTLSTGLPSLDAYIGGWKPGSNYVIGGQPAAGASALKITLADAFSRLGGRLLWIGNQHDFRLVTMRLLLREARIEHSDSFNVIQVTEAEKAEAFRAHERMCERSIILFDIADVGNSEAEGELLALLPANQPTWIVVEPSTFEDHDLDAAEAAQHRRAINKFLDRVQETSPISSGLWQVPLPGRIDGRNARRPTFDDVMSPVRLENTEVVIFAHREHVDSPDPALRGQAELIIAKNDFGPTGTIPMWYKPEFSTWQDRDAARSAIDECEAGYHFELSLRESNDH